MLAGTAQTSRPSHLPKRHLVVLAVGALAIGQQPASLNAQAATHVTPARSAAVAATYRELSNAIATQASAYVRAGQFPWQVWQAPTDSLVTVVIVEASRAGWNAIALHRADPGIRCAVAFGGAAPLLNAERADGRPFCVGENGDAIPPGPMEPDSSWIFWWQDEALDHAPRLTACPPLKIARRPKTNDSLYAEFIVGIDGAVEPSPIAIESSGDLRASVAMLMRLNGCRFEPARVRNVAVRALMRQTVGLAPNRPLRKSQASDSSVADSLMEFGMEHLWAMQASLRTVAAAQTRYDSVAGTYAPSLRNLDIVPATSSMVHVAILSWSATSWSTVAIHDSTNARCFSGVGDSIPLPASRPQTDEPFCIGSNGLWLTQAFPPALTAGQEGETSVVDQPPIRRSCNTRLLYKGDLGHPVEIVLEFVVGVDGKPEPRTLRVVESSGVVYDAAAIQMVASCRYVPGKTHGKPVRVLVRQPVTFRPG